MSKQTYVLTGTLLSSDKQPLANLRIEAWDKDMLADDFVGEVISNEQCNFIISFTQSWNDEI